MKITNKTELLRRIFELGKELENSNNNTESMMIVHDMENSIDEYVKNLFPKKPQFIEVECDGKSCAINNTTNKCIVCNKTYNDGIQN